MEIITTEEYNSVLERLEEIAQEYQNLEKAGLADSFEELLIKIHRDNCKIDKEIDLLVKQFLSNLHLENDDIKTKLQATIQSLRMEIESRKLNEEIKEPVEVTSISAHFSEFKVLYDTIYDEIEKKKANNYLKNYVEMILEEESNLQAQKKQYEKQQKKLYKKTFLPKFRNI